MSSYAYLLEGLSVHRVFVVTAVCAAAAGAVVGIFLNTYVDLLVTALCVGYTCRVLFTMAGNIRQDRIPREAMQMLAVVAGSVLGTILAGVVKGRSISTMFTERLARLWPGLDIVHEMENGPRRDRLRPEALQRGAPRHDGGALRERLGGHPAQLEDLVASLASRLAPRGPEHLRWIKASVGSNVRLIPVEEVLFFQSDENYTRVVTQDAESLIRKPIRELLDELDPAKFWQIQPRDHRQRRPHRRGQARTEGPGRDARRLPRLHPPFKQM